MAFLKESEFEEAVIRVLQQHGWDDKGGVLKYPDEQQLIDNWASILFDNNRDRDRLDEYPLTKGEMGQILDEVANLRTPLLLNSFINGKYITIIRDNPEDKAHFGKAVSLKIYDRQEIAAGDSRYQIAQQPRFKRKSKVLNDKRGDLMLLINGMPVIHLELKRSGVPISEAEHQIENYMHEGVFSGIFSLVQVFVAMSPEETHYFANPGPDGMFNKSYFFHWADFNNEPMNNWKDVTSNLLNIPMAHQLIGFYTVADSADGVLKVMRSYQYYAASAISNRVRKAKWGEKELRGGYVWHTTGSGKTMTSFKSAQLIAESKDADKVVFLMDRVELGTQSLKEYRAFSDESLSVEGTENTAELRQKLASDDPANTLIVTSIQKMSLVKDDGVLNGRELERMQSKRIVFIIDECHRSTFGEMLATIKETFPGALFFGFTGTPIHEENERKHNTTTSVFGDELHRYSIADGIRDGNVLGFDPHMVLTYRDKDVREQVGLHEAKAQTIEEANADPGKKERFYYFIQLAPMAGKENGEGVKEKGVEDFIPNAQYDADEYRELVVRDICEQWPTLSRSGMFHAIFATSSIPEAIEYYRIFKREKPELRITALFDPNIDNNGTGIIKADGLQEIYTDYNRLYDKDFRLATHDAFKRDVAARLAHKTPYIRIDKAPEERLDILIVVDQMLTGFDSKWINTLYLDKMLKYENIIQAFSRTNRLFGPTKPFGNIRYYRRPHTMRKNIEDAVRLYSGDKPFGLFVQKRDDNQREMNIAFTRIREVFEAAGVENFGALPEDVAARGKFAACFKELTEHLEAARIQGFSWENANDPIQNEDGTKERVPLDFTEQDYLVLAQRYKEFRPVGPVDPPEPGSSDDVPFEIEGYLTEIDTGKIDNDYMQSNFTKWLKALAQKDVSPEELDRTWSELHKSFASLSQDDQHYAEVFLHDIESGDAHVVEGKSLMDYIVEYRRRAEDKRIVFIADALGVDVEKLIELMSIKVDETTINEYGRFDELMDTLDKPRARAFFERREGENVPPFKVRIKADALLRSFILKGGFDLE